MVISLLKLLDFCAGKIKRNDGVKFGLNQSGYAETVFCILRMRILRNAIVNVRREDSLET